MPDRISVPIQPAKEKPKGNRGGTRTRNFRISTLFRSPTPYPLGHTTLWMTFSQQLFFF